MSSTNWRVVIADAPHREDLFAEIWIDDEQFGEVYLKDGKPVIEVYAHRVDSDWRFQYEILQDIFIKTDDFLKSMGYSRI
jgi:hypothetical protein